MIEVLDTIGRYLWVCDFATLAILLTLAWQHKTVSSSLIAVTITVIIGGVSLQYGPMVLAIKGPDTAQGVRIAWYMGFAIFDAVAVYAIYKSLRHHSHRFGPALNVLLVTLAIAVMISGITAQYGPLLFAMEGPEYKVWVRFAWYMGFVFFDGLAIYAIYKTHRVFRKSNSFITQMILLAFFVKAMCHIIRFIERYTWNTDHLKAIYRWSIVSINVSATMVALVIACLALYRHYQRNNIYGAVWKI